MSVSRLVFSLGSSVLVLKNPQNFNKLNVYREAYSLSKDVYNELRDVEKHFRLKDQLFGSTTSICTNLTEMSAFENKNQQRQKIIVCIGECNESEFWLNFCRDAGLIDEGKYKKYVDRLTRIRMMLFNLMKTICFSSPPPSPTSWPLSSPALLSENP